MLTDATTLQPLIAQLQRDRKLPAGLSPQQLGQLQRALQKYSGEVSQRVLQKILEDWKEKIQSAQSLGTPEINRGIIADLGNYLNEDAAEGVRFALKVSQEVSSGAGQYLNQNLSPEAVDEFPALEFKRLFSRTIPRGFKAGRKGAIIPDPDDAWPARWAAAGAEAGDDDWLPWEGDAQGGRGVALKSSGIWQALGDGAGGYTDTLGNPFPPFAFNSGFMTLDVSRAEAQSLGLLHPGQPARPAPVQLSNLFAEVA